jgi:hypothetical protein
MELLYRELFRLEFMLLTWHADGWSASWLGQGFIRGTPSSKHTAHRAACSRPAGRDTQLLLATADATAVDIV